MSINVFDNARELERSLTRIIEKVIDNKTKNCLRTYKAKVVSAPNVSTGKCEVKILGDSTTLTLPFSSAVQEVSVGDMVWVATNYNSFINAVVWQTIDFK